MKDYFEENETSSFIKGKILFNDVIKKNLIKNHLNEIIKQSMWCCQILENKMKDSVDASAFNIISKLEKKHNIL